MTKNDILRMAEEAGFKIRNGHIYPMFVGSIAKPLHRFANCIADHVREKERGGRMSENESILNTCIREVERILGVMLLQRVTVGDVSRLIMDIEALLGRALSIAGRNLAADDEPAKPLQIQAGKKYRSKDDEIFIIDACEVDCMSMKFSYYSRSGIAFDSGGRQITSNGKYIQLVEEVAE